MQKINDIKVSKTAIKQASDLDLNLTEFVFLSYLSTFNSANNEALLKISDILNVSELTAKRTLKSLKVKNLLDFKGNFKQVTDLGMSVKNTSLRSKQDYFYLKLPFNKSLQGVNYYLAYLFLSQKISSSKRTVYYNGKTYKAYTSTKKINTYCVEELQSVLNLAIQTAYVVFNKLVNSNYLAIYQNCVIDLGLPDNVESKELNTVSSVVGSEFLDVQSFLNFAFSNFDESQKKEILDKLTLHLQSENKTVQTTKKVNDKDAKYYDYPLLDLPELPNCINGNKYYPHFFNIYLNEQSNFSESEKQDFYSFCVNLGFDMGRENSGFNFLKKDLDRLGIESVEDVKAYVLRSYKENVFNEVFDDGDCCVLQIY